MHFSAFPNRPFPTVVGTPRRDQDIQRGAGCFRLQRRTIQKIRQLVTGAKLVAAESVIAGPVPAISTMRAHCPWKVRDKLNRRKSSRVDPPRKSAIAGSDCFYGGPKAPRFSPCVRGGASWSKAWHLPAAMLLPLPPPGSGRPFPRGDGRCTKCDCLAFARRSSRQGSNVNLARDNAHA
jgi:hypothetical protein